MNSDLPDCENISIDYAVLESAANVRDSPTGDFGWNDVGSWNAVYELLARDENGNVLRAETLANAAPATTSTPKASWWRCWASKT